MRAIYIILLIFIVGCTPTPTVKNREVFKQPKTNYINHNPRSDALVVGVGKYKNRIKPLGGVEKDLKNIKKFFGHLNINNITTLSDSQATLSEIRRAFYSYIHSDRNRFGNTFLFYYSGHGVQVTDKDGDEKDKKDEATALYDINLNKKKFITEGILLDDELYSMLGQIKSKKIIIFDKCHSGSSHRGYNPYIKAVEGEYKVEPKFLEQIKVKSRVKKELKDFVIFSATKDDQEAEDSPVGGLFTNSFIDGILHKKADMDDNRKITVDELESFCGTNIANLAVNIQKEHKGVMLKGNFNPSFVPKEVRGQTISSIFNLRSPPKAQQTTLLESTLDSLVSYDTIQLSLLGGKSRFREHDRVRFELKSSKSGYLNIFIAYQDSYRLFMKNQKIEEDRLYAFPNDFMVGKHLVAKRPLGLTKVYALLSRQPLSIKEYLSKEKDDLNLTNYVRKGLMTRAVYKNNQTKKEPNILTISKIEFRVLN